VKDWNHDCGDPACPVNEIQDALKAEREGHGKTQLALDEAVAMRDAAGQKAWQLQEELKEVYEQLDLEQRSNFSRRQDMLDMLDVVRVAAGTYDEKRKPMCGICDHLVEVCDASSATHCNPKYGDKPCPGHLLRTLLPNEAEGDEIAKKAAT